MSFNIDNWLSSITAKLKEEFNEELLFIGLQGSYNRGEATPQSDIDLIVILETLDFQNLTKYKNILNNMPYKEKACGFISGKKEIQNWSKSDLFQFYYDTKPLYGKLSEIIEPPEIEDIKKAVKSSCETIYHSASHSYLHSQNARSDLISIYKMSFFVLQAKYFINNKKYISTKRELINLIYGEDKSILEICMNNNEINNKSIDELDSYYSKIIEWSQNNI